MDVKTTYHGDDDLKRGMDKTARDIPGRIYRAMVQSCSLVETRAKTYHLAGHTLQARTHSLQRSVKSKVGNEIGKTVGRVGVPKESPAGAYAAIHEFGGIIRPRNAKYLAFQINGKWIRTKEVKMPKREWLSKSLNDVKGQIEKIFGREIKIAIG